MKLENFSFVFYIYREKREDKYHHDCHLEIGEVEFCTSWRSDAVERIQPGDAFRLSLPSGILTGYVLSKKDFAGEYDETRLKVIHASWKGKVMGLLAGTSPYGCFIPKIGRLAIVTDSWFLPRGQHVFWPQYRQMLSQGWKPTRPLTLREYKACWQDGNFIVPDWVQIQHLIEQKLEEFCDNFSRSPQVEKLDEMFSEKEEEEELN